VKHIRDFVGFLWMGSKRGLTNTKGMDFAKQKKISRSSDVSGFFENTKISSGLAMVNGRRDGVHRPRHEEIHPIIPRARERLIADSKKLLVTRTTIALYVFHVLREQRNAVGNHSASGILIRQIGTFAAFRPDPGFIARRRDGQGDSLVRITIGRPFIV